MQKLLLLGTFLYASVLSHAAADTLTWKRREGAGFRLFYTDKDTSLIISLEKNLAKGSKAVYSFFHTGFKKSFDVFIFPDRISLDAQWEKDWHVPGFKGECWMVASGVAHRLDILSPLAWARESCDHNARDAVELQQIITHELVHVFHAQQNPNPGFDGMDDLSWLIEGLADYASGQLTKEKIQEVRDDLASGNIPSSLADLWKGKLRYQRAGSIIRFIDKKYGRKKLFRLLSFANNTAILKALGITEKELLESWIEK